MVPTESRQHAVGIPGLWGHCSHCVGGVTVEGMLPEWLCDDDFSQGGWACRRT